MLIMKTAVTSAPLRSAVPARAGTVISSRQITVHAEDPTAVTVPRRPSSPSCRWLLLTMKMVSSDMTGI